MNTFKRTMLVGATALFAALSITSANASAKLCQKVLGQCNSQCAKRPIGKDICFAKCERAWMNCD